MPAFLQGEDTGGFPRAMGTNDAGSLQGPCRDDRSQDFLSLGTKADSMLKDKLDFLKIGID
jgi:hypothetical protein